MPGMNERFDSNGLSLACHIARPPGEVRPGPGVILCHGFPIGPLDAQLSAGTFPQLVDRVASSLGCVAMTFNFRGCGDSEGDFSLQGWHNMQISYWSDGELCERLGDRIQPHDKRTCMHAYKCAV